jgi:hypothetical protein
MEGRPNAYQSRISAVKRCFLGLRGAEHDFAELKPLRQKGLVSSCRCLRKLDRIELGFDHARNILKIDVRDEMFR